MKWYAISGSWRHTNKQVEKDVHDTVKQIVENEDGILTGGALGVDYMATKVVLEKGNVKNQLRIYLPVDIETYKNHFFKRAGEGVISHEQANNLVSQLDEVCNLCPKCVFDETNFSEVNKESYHARNTSIVENCDELYAFQINDSKGTQDSIDKANNLGRPVHVKRYSIPA